MPLVVDQIKNWLRIFQDFRTSFWIDDFQWVSLCEIYVQKESDCDDRRLREGLDRRQALDAQIAMLKDAGCSKVFKEKASGARTDRSQLGRLIASLAKGDVVIVTRLDRLARSTRDLLNVLATIGECGAGLRSLADAWADTTSPHGRLMLAVLGGLAEFEADLIRTRTGEGRQRAMARGVKMGRRPKLTPHQRNEAIARRASGEALAAIGRTFGVSHSTISRLR